MERRPCFISYRRKTDGAAADTLRAVLVQELGPDGVFFDAEPKSLPYGSSWPVKLIHGIVECNTLLPVMGPDWLAEIRLRNLDPEGNWIPADESTDWVRLEIGYALQLRVGVVAVLVNGAKMPDQAQLPPELALLPDRQSLKWPMFVTDAVLKPLIEAILGTGDFVTPEVLRPLGSGPAVAATPHESVSDSGQRWEPTSERESPHAMDYKFCVRDPALRKYVRVGLLSAHRVGSIGQGLTLTELRTMGEPWKYLESAKKKGMFIQASCIVTNGMDGEDADRFLICIREDHQFHENKGVSPRNVAGESCLIGTCLTSFDTHRGTGHLAVAILNDLQNPNNWAVFSRKLLVPDSVIDSKFLGVGFNLSAPEKEYVHFVWHVRTRNLPDSMLVPEREKKLHDVPVWVSKDTLCQFDFEKAPIDRCVLESVFGLTLATPKKTKENPWFTGFLRFPAFDNTRSNGDRPERWIRETVALDLLRMFQQSIHKGKYTLVSTRPDDILIEFATYVDSVARKSATPIRVAVHTIGENLTPFNSVVKVVVCDEVGQAIGEYAVLAVETSPNLFPDTLVEKIREFSETGIEHFDDAKAILVIQGIQTKNRFEIQGAVSLHDTGRMPIYVVGIALGSDGLPFKRVAHAIIPIAGSANEVPDSLLITQTKGDQRPRLPGGKIEGVETPAQALVRELKEELDLDSHEFTVGICTIADGVNAVEISPSRRERTRYRIFPFVVRVLDKGIEKIRRLLEGEVAGGVCRVSKVTFAEWTRNGLGFNDSYPKTVMARITPEHLKQAALIIE